MGEAIAPLAPPLSYATDSVDFYTINFLDFMKGFTGKIQNKLVEFTYTHYR
jgi:hypothetical protein